MFGQRLQASHDFSAAARIAGVAALAFMAITAIVLYLPSRLSTAIVAGGVLIFVVVFVWVLSRAFWIRCLNMASLTVGAVAAFNVSSVKLFGAFPQGTLGAVIEGRHWSVDLGLIAFAVVCMIVGYLSWRRERPAPDSPAHTTTRAKTTGDYSPVQISTGGPSSGAAVTQVAAGGDAAGRNVNKPVTIIEHLEVHARGADIRIFLHQLPSPPEDFTGRQDELLELMSKIGSGGVTISGVRGMAGVGKTALALKLAEQLAAAYPHGQIFFNLRGADPARQAPATTAEAMRHVILSFGLDRTLPEDQDGLCAMYQSELHDRRVLLLMDNAADARQVEPLIPPRGCVLLVTSRRHFDLPGLFAKNLDVLPPDKARELLLTVCPRIDKHADKVAELCGCLPLALRIAGSAVSARPDITPAEYVTRLEAKRLETLDGVEASISLSEALLADDQRRRFHELGVFPGSFDRAAPAAVWQLEPEAAHDVLGLLVQYSLLQWDDTAKRYHLHDLVRLVAEKRLSDDTRESVSEKGFSEPRASASGLGAMEKPLPHGRGSVRDRASHMPSESLCRRHAGYYCTVLASADDLYLKGGDDTLTGLALFDQERVNIDAGFNWARARLDTERDAARLCSQYPNAGVYCLILRQHPDERITWLTTALQAAQSLKDEAAQAGHLGNLGLIYETRGDLDQAETMLRKSLEINEKLGRLQGMASQYGNLGNIYFTRGDLDQAETMLRKALAIEEKLGRLEGIANAYVNLGLIYKARGDLDQAETMLRKSLAIEEKLGRLEGMAGDYGNLGLIYKARGDLDQAEKMHRKALAINEKLGRLEGMASQYGNLGVIYRTRGDLDQAETMHRKSLAIEEKLGRLEGMASDYGNLGLIYKQRGELRSAREYWTKARDLFTKIGMRPEVAKTQALLDGLE